LAHAAALYCRVSTADQTCARQERDLRAFAKKAGYKVVGVWKEIASGAKLERAERKKVLAFIGGIWARLTTQNNFPNHIYKDRRRASRIDRATIRPKSTAWLPQIP
jgi:predicted site-specific integrase-resolvase